MLIDGTIEKKRAFLWHPDFGMYALPLPAGLSPTSTNCNANSLNDLNARSGVIQVVGYCGSQAIRWTVHVLTQ